MATATPSLPDELLTPGEAAKLLRTNPRTLANWRVSRRYPLPWVKPYGRVMYRRSDVEAFIEGGAVNPSA